MNKAKEKISQFQMLNVLTMITLCWSGLQAFSSIANFFFLNSNQEDVKELISKTTDKINIAEDPFSFEFLGGLSEIVDKGFLLNCVTLSVFLISILGAFLMRKLQKTGYFIYIFACIMETSIPFYIIESSMMKSFFLISTFFSILFIILYSVNYKYLKY